MESQIDGSRTSSRRQYLSRIENVLRIERLLQCAHGLDRFGAEFRREVLLLALPDAVLPGAGAAHRLRALHKAMHEVLAARHFVAIIHVPHQRALDIPPPALPTNRQPQIDT